jgi:protein MpaA
MLEKGAARGWWKIAALVCYIIQSSLIPAQAAIPKGSREPRLRVPQRIESSPEKQADKPANAVAPAVAQAAAQSAARQQLELGRSVEGRAITATIYGAGKKRVIVFGGIHGNETASPVLARALAASFEREPPPKGLTVIVVPEVNPDGVFARTRVNANSVDINRNFPAKNWRADFTEARRNPGPQAASEPETRAVMALIERYPPDLVITIHSPLYCVNWDGPAQELAAMMALKNGYRLCPYLGYETPGSLGSYVGLDRSVPTPTIELQETDTYKVVRDNLPALRAALNHFFFLNCCPHTDKYEQEQGEKPQTKPSGN